MRHVGFEIHLRTPTRKHLCLIFLSSCQEETRPRPALIFIANHFEMVKKRTGSGMSSLVHQSSLVSGHWILKPLDRGSNLIDLQRYSVFLILDQPEKTLGSVRLKCTFFLFFKSSFSTKRLQVCFLTADFSAFYRRYVELPCGVQRFLTDNNLEGNKLTL